jgi:hypothetical protein
MRDMAEDLRAEIDILSSTDLLGVAGPDVHVAVTELMHRGWMEIPQAKNKE